MLYYTSVHCAAKFHSLHLNNDIARVRSACRPGEEILATQSRRADLFHERTTGGNWVFDLRRPAYAQNTHTRTHVRTCWCYSVRVLTRDAIKTSSPLCVSTKCGRGWSVGRSLQVALGIHAKPWRCHTYCMCSHCEWMLDVCVWVWWVWWVCGCADVCVYVLVS